MERFNTERFNMESFNMESKPWTGYFCGISFIINVLGKIRVSVSDILLIRSIICISYQTAASNVLVSLIVLVSILLCIYTWDDIPPNLCQTK